MLAVGRESTPLLSCHVTYPTQSSSFTRFRNALTLSLSVCGEHGGDPKSIFFFDKLGLNYVSCSPYRVPVARLAAGQARVKRRMEEEKKRAAVAAPAETKQVGVSAADSPTNIMVQ